MRNMFYLLTRQNLKELEDEQNGLGYFLLMGLFVMGLFIDTIFSPVSLLLSLMMKRNINVGVNE